MSTHLIILDYPHEPHLDQYLTRLLQTSSSELKITLFTQSQSTFTADNLQIIQTTKITLMQQLTAYLKTIKEPVICLFQPHTRYVIKNIQNISKSIENKQTDIILGHRSFAHNSPIRKIVARTHRFIVGQILHGIDGDLYSGIVMFPRQILTRINLDTTPELLFTHILKQAQQHKYRLTSVPLTYFRVPDESKMQVVWSLCKITGEAIYYRFTHLSPLVSPHR